MLHGTSRWSGLGAATAMAALLACDLLGPQAGFQPGVVVFYSDGPEITVPDTVSAGVPFTVSVLTYGDGCVEKGPTQIAPAEREVRIEPYDRHSGSNTCPSVLNLFNHEAQVTFEELGEAEVMVLGKELPSGRSVTLSRSVIVQ